MASEAAVTWRQCFQHWPTDVEHRGVIVTSYNEQIAFDGFAIADEMLLIERRTPDTSGARMIIIPYQNIQALKIVDVVKMKSFQSMGFVAPPPRK
jgi:hypothetical protein